MALPESGGRRAEIEKALLDYHRSPGKHALLRRQPAVLFASIKEVLQLASGRSPEGDESDAPPPVVRHAACFFIRSAMLYPDADHYALLGLQRTADAAGVKDRYRLMMRLMHPDFANALSGANWPADAATRLNRAYEVLSSPVQRRAYDEQLDPPRAASPRVAPAMKPGVAKVQQPEDPRRRLKRLATVFGLAGGIAAIAAWHAAGQPDKETLVQRSAPPPLEVVAVADPPPAPLPAQTLTPLPLIVAQASVVPAPMALAAGPVARAAARAAAPAPAPVIALAPPPVPRAEPPRVVPASTPPATAPASVPPPPLPQAAAPVAPVPGSPTMAEVHPILTHLLQQLESGWGDRVLGLLDRESRAAPGAQALLEKYNNLVDGMRPIRLSNAQFRTAEAREGRLLVIGRVMVQVRDTSVPPRELAVQAEFAARDGAVVLTRLAPARD